MSDPSRIACELLGNVGGFVQPGFRDKTQVSPPALETSDDERAAACALTALTGIGAQSLKLISERFGSLADAVAAGGEQMAQTPELRADGVASLRAAKRLDEQGRSLLERARAMGARVLLLSDADYPSLLAQAPNPPPVLYVMGQLPEARRAAVVGSRSSDRYGIERATAVTQALVLAGVEVVSGGAAGVDKHAHEFALEAGARTIAVVGTGLAKCYPSSHQKLYERIARKGAVVSEFSLDGGGQRAHFPRRNRTIAGLSEAVVFVRGRSNSGAISTCDAAGKFGRPVFAVPGNVGDPLAEGPNQMLASGAAKATLDGAELVQALGLVGSPRPPPAAVHAVAPPGTETVLAALGAAPKHVDEVARDAAVSTANALQALLELELAGLCTTLPGTYFQRR